MYLRQLLYGAVLFVLVAGGVAFATAGQTKSLPSRENDEGQVMVAVTPISVSGETWRFAVQLNTHVTPLSQDLAAVSTLGDGKGFDEPASAWNGDPPGGHHRKGVLVFKALKPMPQSITLKIRGVGSIAERTFTWDSAALLGT